jgi:hypothetical protein
MDNEFLACIDRHNCICVICDRRGKDCHDCRSCKSGEWVSTCPSFVRNAPNKVNPGDKVRVVKKVCYGSVHGLVKIVLGTILTVKSVDEYDEVETVETITLNGVLGEATFSYNLFYHQYEKEER